MYIWEEIGNSSKGKENNLLGNKILYTNIIGGKCDWKQKVEGEKQAEKDKKNTKDEEDQSAYPSYIRGSFKKRKSSEFTTSLTKTWGRKRDMGYKTRLNYNLRLESLCRSERCVGISRASLWVIFVLFKRTSRQPV